MSVKPLGDRVLVQPVEEQEVKKGGIIIPDTALLHFLLFNRLHQHPIAQWFYAHRSIDS